MAKKGIIFDMDGTLWDSSEGVAVSWMEIINREYGMERVITSEDVQSVMGKTMDKIAEALFPEIPKEPRLELLRKCCEYENEYLGIHGGILYPDLEDTLKVLQGKYDLYIVSNCQAGYIEAFLEHYGFQHYFKDIECYGNSGYQKSENIRIIVERNHLDKAVYVGDIQGDYDAAMAAGVSFIHAAYGFGTIAQETAEISAFAELPKAAGEILGE